MSLDIEIVTIFPSYFDGPLEASLLGKARKKKLVNIRVHNLRDYTHDRHKTLDDKPFGGGPGMIMKPEPIFECVESIRDKGWIILLDPHGQALDQKLAASLAEKKHLILISGHYEGVDHRVRENLVDQEISVGDFITMGGEAPALCLIEAVMRFVPGVLGNEKSLEEESFHNDSLEYPQYTRPQNYQGWKVPDVLVSGNHAEVAKWRREKAKKLTRERRPDLKN